MLSGLHGRALAQAGSPGPTPGGFARNHSSEKCLAILLPPLRTVANAVGTTCRRFESHQLHFSPMRNRQNFGAVAQSVEQYRFTILVATVLRHCQNTPQSRISPGFSSAFDSRNTSANAGAEYIGKAGSNPASRLVQTGCVTLTDLVAEALKTTTGGDHFGNSQFSSLMPGMGEKSRSVVRSTKS